VDVLFVDFQSRIPSVNEERMLNYIMVLALEDGLSMPANISRLVAQSKTFLTQAAGASILAFGHAYGAFSAFGNRLQEYAAKVENDEISMTEVAEIMVKEHLNDEGFGVSGLMVKDPAAKRMFARAKDLGVAGKYIELTERIVKAAKKESAEAIDLDMLGAIGATMMDLGFSPEAIWAIIAITRSFAAGAHYIEEVERGGYTRFGETLTPKAQYDGPQDRPVPTLKDRQEYAKSAQTHTLNEWSEAFTQREQVFGTGYKIKEEIEDPSKKTGIKKIGR
jgi:citrate synthase